MAAKNLKKSPKHLEILIANGVNLDLLGQREPDIYGHATLADIEARLGLLAPGLCLALGAPSCRLHFFQSNAEEAFLCEIAKPFDGALINPGAWTHTSLALADRLKAVRLPFVEVHLSHLGKREPIRANSFSAPHALGVVYGLGVDSYVAGLAGLLAHLVSGADIRPKGDSHELHPS